MDILVCSVVGTGDGVKVAEHKLVSQLVKKFLLILNLVRPRPVEKNHVGGNLSATAHKIGHELFWVCVARYGITKELVRPHHRPYAFALQIIVYLYYIANVKVHGRLILTKGTNSHGVKLIVTDIDVFGLEYVYHLVDYIENDLICLGVRWAVGVGICILYAFIKLGKGSYDVIGVTESRHLGNDRQLSLLAVFHYLAHLILRNKSTLSVFKMDRILSPRICKALNSLRNVGANPNLVAEFHPFLVYLGVALVFHCASHLYYDRIILIIDKLVNHILKCFELLFTRSVNTVASHVHIWIIEKKKSVGKITAFG